MWRLVIDFLFLETAGNEHGLRSLKSVHQRNLIPLVLLTNGEL